MTKVRNLISYIESNGDYSFDLVEFNELDSAIFSSLSYINFEGILKFHSRDTITIYEAGSLFFKKYTKKQLRTNVFSVQTGIKIFASIYKTKRYKDLTVNKYVKVVNDNIQFQAINININSHLSYISFEGTDDLVSGWMEDAAMCYKFPVPSQKEAIRYVNSHINPFSKREYILGGHSKGGNLALVAAIKSRYISKSKIKKIYMFDAPGLRDEEIYTKEYKEVKDKIVRFIPNYSVVGLLFGFTSEPIVIKSFKKGVMAHNMINWCIEDTSFKYEKLSSFSEKFKAGITDWLSTYNDDERKEFVKDLFEIFSRAKIHSVLDVKKNTIKNLVIIIKESKKLDAKSKKIINTFLKFFIDFLKEESTTLISSKIPKLKH